MEAQMEKIKEKGGVETRRADKELKESGEKESGKLRK